MIGSLLLKIKRGQTPLYRAIRAAARWVFRANAPLPSPLKPVLRGLYELRLLVLAVLHRIYVFAWAEPLFRARCASAGCNMNIGLLPTVLGHTEIHVGNDVSFTGSLWVTSGRFYDHPRLVIKDRAGIGAGSVIVVNQEVVIEEDVIISPNCRIQDSDGHRKEADLRARNAPLTARDIRPVRICRHAWIGTGSQIMKGVTIGEGAIVGANSVVITDIPPYSLAMGNPAEVLMRNVGKPKPRTAAS